MHWKWMMHPVYLIMLWGMQTCLSLVSVKIAWLSERCTLKTVLGSTEELESHSLVCATATGSGHCPLPPGNCWNCWNCCQLTQVKAGQGPLWQPNRDHYTPVSRPFLWPFTSINKICRVTAFSLISQTLCSVLLPGGCYLYMSYYFKKKLDFEKWSLKALWGYIIITAS